MKKLNEFLEGIRKKDNKSEENTANQVNTPNIQIRIEGDAGYFKDEKEQIIAGAKSLLETKAADNMEDAIITFATMFRGLKFKEVRKEGDKIIVVLRETAQLNKKIFNKDNDLTQ